MAMRNHFREAVWARCSPSQVIPRDLQTGAIGQKLLAIWAPNLQQLGLESHLMALSRPYPATLAEDLGSDLARVDWEDGDSYYRQVPWSWLRTSDGSGCHAVGEGCAAHSQCPFGGLERVVRGVPWVSGTYCFSCDTCSMAYGGLPRPSSHPFRDADRDARLRNPPPGLCDPCPTHRGGRLWLPRLLRALTRQPLDCLPSGIMRDRMCRMSFECKSRHLPFICSPNSWLEVPFL